METRVEGKEKQLDDCYVRTQRAWLRPVGTGGDRSSIVWSIDSYDGNNSPNGPTVTLSIALTDCHDMVSFDYYVSKHEHWKRQLASLDLLLDQITEAKIALYNEVKKYGYQTESGQDT